jgi:hypothetical protein
VRRHNGIKSQSVDEPTIDSVSAPLVTYAIFSVYIGIESEKHAHNSNSMTPS